MLVVALDLAGRNRHLVEEDHRAAELTLEQPAHRDDVVGVRVWVRVLAVAREHHRVAVEHRRVVADVTIPTAPEVKQVVLVRYSVVGRAWLGGLSGFLVRAVEIVVPGDITDCAAEREVALRLAEGELHLPDAPRVGEHRRELRDARDLAVAAHQRQHRNVMPHARGRLERLPHFGLEGVHPRVIMQDQRAVGVCLHLVSGGVGQAHPGRARHPQEAVLGAHHLREPSAPVLDAHEVAQKRAVQKHLPLEAVHLVIPAHLPNVVAIARATRRVQVLLVVDAVGEEDHRENGIRGILGDAK